MLGNRVPVSLIIGVVIVVFECHTRDKRPFSDRSFLKILIFSTIYGRFRGAQANLPHPPLGIGLKSYTSYTSSI